jgi:spore germination protein
MLSAMYQRLAAVLFPVVAVALTGAALWGYYEHQDKNALLIKAENQYQRAFHELTYYMDQLQSELGKARAASRQSESFQRKELAQVWRMTSEAQNQINQLPLTLLPFNKTEEFLDRLATFSHQTSLRDFRKQPLTDDELATLKTLHERAKELSDELRAIQSKSIKDGLRWMDVEMALASEDKKMDNAIIDGFKTVDEKVAGYSEVEWGPSVMSLYEKRTPAMLEGKPASEADIRQAAVRFLGEDPGDRLSVTENGQGTEYASWSVRVDRPDGDPIRMDFTKQGGLLLWFSNPRDAEDSRLSPEQATRFAREFLESRHYKDEFVPVNYDEYEHTGNITFAVKEGDVTVYTRKLVVKVALDDGEVLGLEARDYVYEPAGQAVGNFALTEEEARQRLNPAFKVATSGKALIKNDFGAKVLCRVFTGRVNGEMFRVFINAETGTEEMVERIQPIESAFENKDA